MIVARPITLILDDDAKKLTEVLHLAGPEGSFRGWNNTGVWRRFAVAAGPVNIPKTWQPVVESKLWTVFRREPDLCVVVHSSVDLGIVHLVRSSDPTKVLSAVQDVNGSRDQLRSVFQIPGGARLGYDVNSPRDRWVIAEINGRSVDRNFDQWPLVDLQ